VTAGQNGNTYFYTLLGSTNVTAGGAGTTSVNADVIPMIITNGSSHDVYDPTAANGACGEQVSPVTGMLSGPLLTKRTWYAGAQKVGVGEYVDAQMREELWAYTNRQGVSPSFHLTLNGSEPAVVTATFNGGAEINGGTCNQLEEFPKSTWDSFVQSTLIPELVAGSWTNSTSLPVFLFKNVVFLDNSNNCCILGYHSAFTDGSGNAQTYSVGDYITDGEFGGNTDLTALSHELAEWANDPFGNNPTPSWGHVGQVSGCQGNLEVGDPLSGTNFAVRPTTPRGTLTFHLQELAFQGWFYDDNIGVNGWYSTRGSFTSGATLCS
jgi:hypothetical protein